MRDCRSCSPKLIRQFFIRQVFSICDKERVNIFPLVSAQVWLPSIEQHHSFE